MSVILYHLLLFTILSFTDCTLVLLTASDTNIKNKQSWKHYRNKGDPVGRRPWAKGVKALGWKNTYFRSSIYNSFSLHFQRGVVACVWAVGHNHDCLLPLVVCLVCLPPDLRMTHHADAGAAATPSLCASYDQMTTPGTLELQAELTPPGHISESLRVPNWSATASPGRVNSLTVHPQF